MKKYFPFILLSILLVGLDQGSKFFFEGKNIPLFSFISFQYSENTGAAFSLFQGHNLALLIISLCALLFVVYSFTEYPLALSFLLAGLLGNLLDRIFFGFVRDFISLSIWPIFNLADAWNTIAVCLLLYAFWKEKKLRKPGFLPSALHSQQATNRKS